MKLINNTYLARVLKENRALFILMCAYILGVLYYASRQREEFPFLLYGMYSLNEYAQPEYITYTITIGDKEINYDELPDTKKELITVPLAKALAAQERFEMDGMALVKLQAWLYEYTGAKEQGGKMSINKLTCRYGEDGRPVIVNKETIAIYGSK